MSIHSDLMRSGAELLFAVQGDAGAAEYERADGVKFLWAGASAGVERGGLEETESGDLLKVTRLTLTGPTAVLVAKGVTEPDRKATVKVAGKVWAVELTETQWGPTIVRLGLVRRPITRHEEAESSAGR